MIGSSLISGADDAFFFAKLNFDSSSTHWRKLSIKSGQVLLIAQVTATIIGSAIYTFDPRLPWLLSSGAFLGAAYLVWSVEGEEGHEPIRDNRPFSPQLAAYLRTLKSGFSHFYRPALRRFVPLILTVGGIFYASEWGLLKLVLLDRFGFSPFIGGLVVAVSSFSTIALLEIVHRIDRLISPRTIFITGTLVTVVALICAIVPLGNWGLFVIIALASGHLMHPYLSEEIHRATDDSARATVVSVGSFLRTLPYIGLAPLIGALNNAGALPIFLVGWSGLTLAALLYFLRKESAEK